MYATQGNLRGQRCSTYTKMFKITQLGDTTYKILGPPFAWLYSIPPDKTDLYEEKAIAQSNTNIPAKVIQGSQAGYRKVNQINCANALIEISVDNAKWWSNRRCGQEKHWKR